MWGASSVSTAPDSETLEHESRMVMTGSAILAVSKRPQSQFRYGFMVFKQLWYSL